MKAVTCKINSVNNIPSQKIPLHNSKIILKADSGASKSFIKQNDAHILTNLKKEKGPVVALPDMSLLTATQQGGLPINGLSDEAKKTYVLPGLHSTSLLSLGQVCDDGCNVILTKDKIEIKKDENIIATGNRSTEDGLWDIVLESKQKVHSKPYHINNKLNVVLNKTVTIRNLICFLHASCFFSSITTFIKAIQNGNFLSSHHCRRTKQMLLFAI